MDRYDEKAQEITGFKHLEIKVAIAQALRESAAEAYADMIVEADEESNCDHCSTALKIMDRAQNKAAALRAGKEAKQ